MKVKKIKKKLIKYKIHRTNKSKHHLIKKNIQNCCLYSDYFIRYYPFNSVKFRLICLVNIGIAPTHWKNQNTKYNMKCGEANTEIK